MFFLHLGFSIMTNDNETKTSEVVPALEKAKDFVKGATPYSGGRNLFSRIKEKMKEVAENTPAMLTVGGAALLVAGALSANPPLVTAGATIMAAGYNALKNEKENNALKPAVALAKVISGKIR